MRGHFQIACASFETRSFGPLLRMRMWVHGTHKPPHAEERAERARLEARETLLSESTIERFKR
jgi:hypothetical protein